MAESGGSSAGEMQVTFGANMSQVRADILAFLQKEVFPIRVTPVDASGRGSGGSGGTATFASEGQQRFAASQSGAGGRSSVDDAGGRFTVALDRLIVAIESRTSRLLGAATTGAPILPASAAPSTAVSGASAVATPGSRSTVQRAGLPSIDPQEVAARAMVQFHGGQDTSAPHPVMVRAERMANEMKEAFQRGDRERGFAIQGQLLAETSIPQNMRINAYNREMRSAQSQISQQQRQQQAQTWQDYRTEAMRARQTGGVQAEVGVLQRQFQEIQATGDPRLIARAEQRLLGGTERLTNQQFSAFKADERAGERVARQERQELRANEKEFFRQLDEADAMFARERKAQGSLDVANAAAVLGPAGVTQVRRNQLSEAEAGGNQTQVIQARERLVRALQVETAAEERAAQQTQRSAERAARARDQLAQRVASEARQQQRQGASMFASNLQGRSPHEQLRMINERLGQTGDPVERANLQAAQRRAQQRAGVNTSIIPMGTYMQMMFGGWEISSALNASFQAQQMGAGESSLRGMQAAMQGVQGASGGIFGGITMAGVNMIDLLSQATGLSGTRVGGWMSDYMPSTMNKAVREAQEGVQLANAGEERIVARRRRELQTAQLEIQAERERIPVQNETERRLMAIRDAADVAEAKLILQEEELVSKVRSADTHADRELAVKAVNDFRRTLPRMQEAIKDLERSQLGTEALALGKARRELSRQNFALEAAAEGTMGIAQERLFENQMEQMLEEADPAKVDLVRRQVALARKARKVDIQSSIKTLQSGTEAGMQRLGRDFMGAGMTDLADQERIAVAQSRNDDERRAIQNRFFVARTELQQQFEDRNETARLGLSGAQEELTALLKRNELQAASIGVRAQTQQSLLAMQQEGMPRDIQAQQAQLGISQLELTKQQYMDQFGGAEYDVRNLATSRPRDEDIGTGLKQISDDIKVLQDILRDLTSED